jgi:glycosyltransferase involved in cell wall biosynthesis
MFENFNRGIHAAQSDYLAFCHDDDEYAPTFVSRSVAFMDAHPAVGLCGSNLVFIGEDGAVLERRGHARHDSLRSGTSFALRILATGRNTLVMPAIFYRRSALPAEGLDTSLSMHFGDFVFLMRMAENGGIGVIASQLVRVRKHADQASRGMTMSEQVPLRTRTLASYCDEFASRHPDQGKLVARMRAANAFSHRTSLLWGWMIAEGDAEASSCIECLTDGFADRALGVSLRALSNLGLRPRRAPELLKLAKLIAARAGL